MERSNWRYDFGGEGRLGRDFKKKKKKKKYLIKFQKRQKKKKKKKWEGH